MAIEVHEYRGVGIAELPLAAGTVYTVVARVDVEGRDRVSFPSLEAVCAWLDRNAPLCEKHGTTLPDCYYNPAELRDALAGR